MKKIKLLSAVLSAAMIFGNAVPGMANDTLPEQADQATLIEEAGQGDSALSSDEDVIAISDMIDSEVQDGQIAESAGGDDTAGETAGPSGTVMETEDVKPANVPEGQSAENQQAEQNDERTAAPAAAPKTEQQKEEAAPVSRAEDKDDTVAEVKSAQAVVQIVADKVSSLFSGSFGGIGLFAQSDGSVDIADGEYTAGDFAFEWGGGTGKAKLTLDKVVVSGGKATGYFTASSSNFSHVYYGGHTGSETDDPAYYDPATDMCGEKVVPVTDKKAEFPVNINEYTEIACRTTAMSEPHWVQYNYTITIDEPVVEEDADYTAVDAALAKVPSDLSIYTDESAKSVEDAVNAVVRDKKSSEQAEVDAMAKAINDAVEALEKKTDPADENETTDLEITNKTGMFKAVTASLDTKDGSTTLVMALSGTGYHELFKGTYEQASVNGANTDNWIHGYQNADGKWEFRIPIEEGETYVPCVAVSDSYYQKYKNGQNSIERAFYPRQFEVDKNAGTLVTGDYEYSQDLTIENNVKMFKPEKAVLATLGGPNSNNYKSALELTMGSDSFDKAYVGKKDEAASAASSIAINGDRMFEIPVRWVETFGDPTTMQTLIGKSFTMSFHSVKKDEWYERIFTLDDAAGKLIIDEPDADIPVEEEIKPPAEGGSSGGNTPSGGSSGQSSSGGNQGGADQQKGTADQYPSNTSGSTGAVDSSTGLKDGTYTLDNFSWSGGTGRVQITCSKVTVRGGQAYAAITFTSDKYGYVKAAGGTYYPTVGNGTSTFEIPVELNKNNKIIGMTTAMSKPHEIEYSIFPYLAAAEGAGRGSSASGNGSGSSGSGAAISVGETNKMDDEAPTIAGLKVAGEGEAVTKHAEYLKVFDYEDNIKLVEIDMRKDTVLDKDYLKKNSDQSKKETDVKKSDAEKEVVINDEAGEKVEEKTKEEYISELYEADVVKYLIVPENAELPAGIEKSVIVVRLPKENLYVTSDETLSELEQIGKLDLVKAFGSKEKDTQNKTISAGLKDKTIAFGGTFDKPDYKTLVKNKVDLIFETSDLLPLNDDVKKERKIKDAEVSANKDLTSDDYKERLFNMTSRYATLGIPMIMDRSGDEESGLAKAEWMRLYGVIFDKEAEANAVIEKAEKAN